MSTRVAAIDCGTNALRLLIADVNQQGTEQVLTEVTRLMRTVRLGEGVDRTGEFSEAALMRNFAVCEEYADIITAHDVHTKNIRMVATSASRDVANRQQFVDGVKARLGIEPEVIDGVEEAQLSFDGATKSLTGLREPVLVVDIGGGSTEFVMPGHTISVNVGCVRMTERHLLSDPPTEVEIACVREDLADAMTKVRQIVPLGSVGTLVGVAGTVTTVAACAMDLPEYDASRLHGARISRQAALDAADRLLRMTRAERAALPFMHPGRVDVIGGGAMVVRALLEAVPVAELVVSECDILDGIAYRLAPS